MKVSIEYMQAILGSQFEYKLLEELARFGQFKTAPVGSYLIRPGEFIGSAPIVISGSIKIMRSDK